MAINHIPKLFSPDMVAALLAGTKLETRRIIKGIDTFKKASMACDVYPYRIDGEDRSRIVVEINGEGVITEQKCDAEIGDLIWVRENWRVGAWNYNNSEIAVDYCDGPRKEWLHVDDPKLLRRLIEQSRADAAKTDTRLRDGYYEYSWSPGRGPTRWRPSIHMPKFASRMTMRVTDYRIERLHDIDEAGAVAEGVEEVSAQWPPSEADEFYGVTYPSYADYGPNANGCYSGYGAARMSYIKLWNAINGPGSWEANPLVSVTKWDKVMHQNVLEVAAEADKPITIQTS